MISNALPSHSLANCRHQQHSSFTSTCIRIGPSSRPCLCPPRSAQKRNVGRGRIFSKPPDNQKRKPDREPDNRHQTEREKMEAEGDSMQLEQIAERNRLMEAGQLLPELRKLQERLRTEDPLAWAAMQLDTRIPPLHTEFMEANSWPEDCDPEQCLRRLLEGYEVGRALSLHLEEMRGVTDNALTVSMAKRLGDVDRLMWSATADDGEVYFRPRPKGWNYNPTLFHSFNNAHAAAIPMPPSPASIAAKGTCSNSSSNSNSNSNSNSDSDSHCGSSSSNSPPVLPRTHVAVGFVDLSTLASAVDLPEWDEQVEAALRDYCGGAGQTPSPAASLHPPSPSSPPPPPLLRWVGYEASPYSVAKTLVLERMMRSGGLDAAEHAVQVWYSAAWTPDTLAAFRRAVTVLLSEHAAAATGPKQQQQLLPPDVLPYMKLWAQRDVGLRESRQRWLADRYRDNGQVVQFKQKSDRLALCEYFLTGQLPGLTGEEKGGEGSGGGGGGRRLVGSVVMFTSLPGGPVRALDESFLEALPPWELLSARLEGGSGGSGGSGGGAAHTSSSSPGAAAGEDVVAAGAAMLRRRVRRLTALLATGRVEVQILHRAVTPDDSATAAAISALHPATMSWSNVPDYCHPSDFHRMARACSTTHPAPHCGPTTHHMHSMNWVYDVKGGSHHDVLLPELADRVWGDSRGNQQHAREFGKNILALVAAGQSAVSEEYSGHTEVATALLLDPPADNPRNIADFGLAMTHYVAWVDAFLAAGGLHRLDPQPASGGTPSLEQDAGGVVTAAPTYWPLARVHTTFSLALVYAV